MARFLIFIATVLLLIVIGVVAYYFISIICIAIKRRESAFEIEKEAHGKIKRKIKEEE